MIKYRGVSSAILAVSVMVLSACGGDDDAATPRTAGTTSVAVTLQEWAVLPAQASAPAGSVTFNVTNKGPKHEHEFIVLKTDLAPNQLETIPRDGAVNVSAAGVDDLLEIEEFAVGTTKTATTSAPLAPGKYILFCNSVEDPPTPDMAGTKAHFKLGMFAQFTVT